MERSEAIDLERLGTDSFLTSNRYFRKHSDHGASFTDCTSFVLMDELEIRAALTTDRHFNQSAACSWGGAFVFHFPEHGARTRAWREGSPELENLRDIVALRDGRPTFAGHVTLEALAKLHKAATDFSES